ncbi:MAG: ral stress protein CsbD [Ramlibacter sp.]|nr:ral stress protein CsbD [Ramlibacter sp.]
MNRNQVNGAIKDALGRVQEHAGKTMGNSEQEAKGLARQGQGRLQKAYGDLKEALKNSRHS